MNPQGIESGPGAVRVAAPPARAPAARRRYLAVFRAGPNSVHRRLLLEDPGRNWDCAVNWWSEPPPLSEPAAAEELAFAGGENKFDGFAAFFARAWQPDWDYRYVLLADDDVYFQPGDLSRLFECCERHAVQLGQPALRWGTNVNHLVTAWNPMSTLRRVSFVEVMTPVFALATLRELVPTFTLSRSTFGIDWAWSALLQGRGAIHVVDAIRVDHLKPVDWAAGALYTRLKSLGVDPAAEMRALRARFSEFGGIRTLPTGHVSSLPGMPAGDALVRAADFLMRAKWRLHDRAWRLVSRLRGRHIPKFPGDTGAAGGGDHRPGG